MLDDPTNSPHRSRIAPQQGRTIPKLLIAVGLFILTASLCLIGYMLIGTPSTTSSEKDAVLADIIRNWQQAHPAEKRFVLMPNFNNEAVLDKETSLVWELSPQAANVTWNEARATCPKRLTGGQKGWRLPAPAEMRSLVGPAVDSPVPHLPPGHPFLNIQPTSYWMVVPEANQPSYARYVDAFLGNVLSFLRIYTYPVWCVQGPTNADDFLNKKQRR